jgi:hypothetical protein
MAARKAKRPMRPMPLIPTLMVDPSMVLEMSFPCTVPLVCDEFMTIFGWLSDLGAFLKTQKADIKPS